MNLMAGGSMSGACGVPACIFERSREWRKKRLHVCDSMDAQGHESRLMHGLRWGSYSLSRFCYARRGPKLMHHTIIGICMSCAPEMHGAIVVIHVAVCMAFLSGMHSTISGMHG